MSSIICIGDLVRRKTNPDQPPMTVYDFASIGGRSYVLGNWLVGTRMFKLDVEATEVEVIQRRRKSGVPRT